MSAPAPPRPVAPPSPARRRGIVVGAVALAAMLVGVALGVVLLSGVRVLAGPLAPLAAAPLDLRTVDWDGFLLPGAVCRSPADIPLHGGQATSVPSSFDGPTPNYPQDVVVDTQRVVYGDVTGDGRPESALSVRCNNHDSTAAGDTVDATLVFDGASGRAALIGTLTSSRPRLGEPPNAVTVTRLSPGRADGSEQFYGSQDANCCPSGTASVTWTWDGSTFDAPVADVRTPADGAPAPSGSAGGVDITVPAMAAVRATPTIDQSNVTGVSCAEKIVTADDAVLGCNVLTTGSALAGVVAVRVVDAAHGDVDTYVMARGQGCPGIPTWAAKIAGDRSDDPCGR